MAQFICAKLIFEPIRAPVLSDLIWVSAPRPERWLYVIHELTIPDCQCNAEQAEDDQHGNAVLGAGENSDSVAAQKKIGQARNQHWDAYADPEAKKDFEESNADAVSHRVDDAGGALFTFRTFEHGIIFARLRFGGYSRPIRNPVSRAYRHS